MYKVYAIGELLIDFMPNTIGDLKHITSFTKAPGGAPANVCGCVSTLGGDAQFIGQVGKDAFGDYLKETLSNTGVDVTTLYQTTEANTALAFVALKNDGNREFSFYRNPSADMLLSYEQIKPLSLQKDILHFCSVSLIDYPIKQTHKRLIDDFIASNGIISFDPNLRLSLWSDHDKLKKTVHDFIPKADILKVSDEELTFITGITDTSEAIQSLFVGRVKAVLYSRGKHGSSLYLKDKKREYNGFKVEAIDTTGAGDAFIGAVLYQIQQMKKPVEEITLNEWDDLMRFSNGVAALTTTKKGAINSLPTLEEVVGFIK